MLKPPAVALAAASQSAVAADKRNERISLKPVRSYQSRPDSRGAGSSAVLSVMATQEASYEDRILQLETTIELLRREQARAQAHTSDQQNSSGHDPLGNDRAGAAH